jgi:HK97 family phage portal protein
VILASQRGNREYRTDFGNSMIPSYMQYIGPSAAGVNLTLQAAVGVPTVGACIRLLAETIGSLPLCVYQGEDANKRKQESSWQSDLLYKQPNPDQSPFDFFSDIASSIETCGNAFVRKLKVRGKVVALYVLDPSTVVVKRSDGNQKTFEIGVGSAKETLTAAQVLHIRGYTLYGGDVGLSPIAQHRQALGAALAGQAFQGSFYANDATPSSYIAVPGPINEQQGKNMIASWNARHQGPMNKGNMAILFNGAELKSGGMPLVDAQWIETQTRSDELAARIFLGPAASLLSGPAAGSAVKTEEETMRFLNFALRPRLARIEGSLKADLDLFAGTNLYPEFHIDDLLRADAATRAEVQHKQVQSGVLLIDEARADEGRPPLPNGAGQVPQLTPVGGAPNPALAEAKPVPAGG